MMDIGSLYMLLNGMGGGGMGGAQPGQQPAQPVQMPQQSSYLPLMRMHGFGSNSALGGPWGAAAPQTPSAQAAMPILQKATAYTPGDQQQGQKVDMASLMMGAGGLNMLFDALRGS